jgi:hypothetical protein
VTYQIKGHKKRNILVKEKLKSHHAFTRYYIVKGVFDNNFNPYLITNQNRYEDAVCGKCLFRKGK